MSYWKKYQTLSPTPSGALTNFLCVFVAAFTVMLSACGSSSSSGQQQINIPLAGNWQFLMSNTPAVTPGSGLQGGFLLEKNDGTITGTIAYSVTRPGETTPCNHGSATVTGTIHGRDVSFTAVAPSQTFTFTGTAAAIGLNAAMAGSYTSTAGTGLDGDPCGDAATLGWTANSLPPVQGFIIGNFHSTGGNAGLSNQNFPLTGTLSQGPNTGASTATVSGTLNFVDPNTNLKDYRCAVSASVQGQISGSAIYLQLLGSDGSPIGQIGSGDSESDVQPVTLDSTSNGYVLHSDVGTAYAVTSSSCPGDEVSGTPGDFGYICIALDNSTACQQPVAIFPAAVSFVETSAPPQKITIKNNAPTLLEGLKLTLANNPQDVENFTVTKDTCDVPGNPLGSTFSILAEQSCSIEITFTPQGTETMTATLTLTSPISVDNNTAFSVPITGTVPGGLGAQALPQANRLPLLSRTDYSWHRVQTLPGSSTRTFREEGHHATNN